MTEFGNVKDHAGPYEDPAPPRTKRKVTKEEIAALEAAYRKLETEARLAQERWYEAEEAYEDELTPAQKEAEFRKEVAGDSRYVSTELARAVLGRLDEARRGAAPEEPG